jgi:hypothetical protein
MNSDKEFPDDVLDIIRQYARPQMRFIKEYNIAIRALKITKWKQVQEKLMLKTDVADKVIKAVNDYAMAVVDLRHTQEQEKTILNQFNYETIRLDTFRFVQDKWKALILIQNELREKNRRCNQFVIVLGRLLVNPYPKRWIESYEAQEDEYEEEHYLIERSYDRMEQSCYQMENTYEGLRLMFK